MSSGFKIGLIVTGLVCLIGAMLIQPDAVPEDFSLELEGTGWKTKPSSELPASEYGVKVDGNLITSLSGYEKEGSILLVTDFKSARFEGLLNGSLQAELSFLDRLGARVLSKDRVEKDRAKGFRIRSVVLRDDGSDGLATIYFFTTDSKGIYLRFVTPYNQAARVDVEAVVARLKVRAGSESAFHTWDDKRAVNRPAGIGKPHLALIFGLLGIMLLGSGLVAAMMSRS